MPDNFVIFEAELIEVRNSDHSHAFLGVGSAFKCKATVDFCEIAQAGPCPAMGNLKCAMDN